jgi:hypothetical protein
VANTRGARAYGQLLDRIQKKSLEQVVVDAAKERVVELDAWRFSFCARRTCKTFAISQIPACPTFLNRLYIQFFSPLANKIRPVTALFRNSLVLDRQEKSAGSSARTDLTTRAAMQMKTCSSSHII